MELDADPVAEPDPLTIWRTPYLDYLLREVLPTNKMEAWWLACHAKSFVVIEGELYKRSHTRILQHCIPIEQGKQLLRDIHGGVYWPTVVAYAEQIVRTCKGCQYYA